MQQKGAPAESKLKHAITITASKYPFDTCLRYDIGLVTALLSHIRSSICWLWRDVCRIPTPEIIGEERGDFAFMASSCNCPASCCFVTDANGLLGRRQNQPAINKLSGRLSLYSLPPSPATGGGRTLTVVSAKRVSSSRRTERVDGRDTISSSSLSSVSPATVPLEEEYEGDFDEEYDEPKLPGDEPNFWEGPQWNTFGFIIRYMWAFGFLFALVACGIAVRTYNFGATDFKETPVYKEAIESQGLFDEAPEISNSEIFEINPTEDAPSPSP